jgi:putative oxidoreductase
MLKLKRFLLGSDTDVASLFLRLALGLTMALAHGKGKLLGFPMAEFPDPLHIGPNASLILVIFAELVCSLLLVLGLWTRLALIPLIINMSVAFFVIHGSDPFQTRELALLYLMGYVTLFFSGPGRFSLDYLFYAKKRG